MWRVISRSRKGAGLGGLVISIRYPLDAGRSAVNFCTGFSKFLRLFFHAESQGAMLVQLLLRGIFPDILRNLHRAEMRPAHGAEMRDLRGIVGQGRVVKQTCGIRVEREVELIFPSKFKSGFRQSVIPGLRARMSLR